MMNERRDIRIGMLVRDAEGKKLGRVISCEETFFAVEKGLFFPRDYRLSYADIGQIIGDEIHMQAHGAHLTEPAMGVGAGQAATRAEQVRVPVAEEVLEAHKRSREAGEVKVTKEVVTEQKEIIVPVTRERVRVEHVDRTERPAQPGEATFKEQAVTIPLREEEVEVTKRPVVREEVAITKETEQREERVAGAVRKERVKVAGKEASESEEKIETEAERDERWKREVEAGIYPDEPHPRT
jgi:uncharacterized protein (TIGR02271 family)